MCPTVLMQEAILHSKFGTCSYLFWKPIMISLSLIQSLRVAFHPQLPETWSHLPPMDPTRTLSFGLGYSPARKNSAGPNPRNCVAHLSPICSSPNKWGLHCKRKHCSCSGTTPISLKQIQEHSQNPIGIEVEDEASLPKLWYQWADSPKHQDFIWRSSLMKIPASLMPSQLPSCHISKIHPRLTNLHIHSWLTRPLEDRSHLCWSTKRTTLTDNFHANTLFAK